MKIAFIGTGLLGHPMAEELLKAKHELNIYNRTRLKAEDLLIYSNCQLFDSAEKAIDLSDLIITVLTNFDANLEILKNVDTLKDKTFFQMGTITSEQNKLLEEKVLSLDGEFIEAPVLGSIPQVQTNTLITLFGGTVEQFNKWKHFLSTFGQNVVHLGDVGKASATKLALNQFIATLTASFSMSLGYILRNNIEVEKFMTILRESALYAPTFDKKLDKMLDRDFTNPNFPLKHLLKDAELIESSFAQTGVETSVLKSLVSVLKKGVTSGNADLDYSSLYNSINPQN